MRLPASLAASFALAALLLSPLGAGATTLLSISGAGDLRISTTGALSFTADGLDLTRADLYADQTITLDPTLTLTPTTSPDVQLVYAGLSGTTVLDLDDDVQLVDFTFQGTIDFSASSITVAGTFVRVDTLALGTATGPVDTGCDPTSGAVLTSTGGSTLQTGGCTVDVVAGPDGPLVGGLAAVPEPGAALLFGAGVLLVGTRLRTQR